MVLKESNLEIFYKFGGITLFLGESNSNCIYFLIRITNNFNIYTALKSMSPLKITLLMELKNYQVMMEKRSHRHLEKGQSGCMRSLISMFRRLLSDKKRQSGQSTGKKLVFLFFLF